MRWMRRYRPKTDGRLGSSARGPVESSESPDDPVTGREWLWRAAVTSKPRNCARPDGLVGLPVVVA
jgi:hypothetical protein